MTKNNFQYQVTKNSMILKDTITGNDAIDDSKLVNVSTNATMDKDLIDIIIKNNNFTLNYEISHFNLEKLYKMISSHILFEQILPCNHITAKRNINLFLELNYLQLDELMVFFALNK